MGVHSAQLHPSDFIFDPAAASPLLHIADMHAHNFLL
jgi:hypothetical protein